MLGLDISASSLKLVELSKDRADNMVLERCGIEPLERGWISEGTIEKFDEVAEAARRLLNKTGARTKQVALALPTSVVISKRVVLPAGLSERELEVQVESEANQYIPFSLDEVSLDFCVVGPSKTSVGDVDVMIAASRKEKLEERQGLVEAVGLTPVVVDVESYASRLAASRVIGRLPGGGAGAMIALFEIGATSSAMQVMRDDDLVYERDQVFGGAQLTQMIARQYGFTAEEAETKKRGGDLPDDFGTAVLEPFVETLAQEVDRALKFFFTSTPNNRVDYVMLAGGSGSLTGLTKAVTRHTSFPCQVINPFDGMEVSSSVREKKVLREAPSYLTACGLAMRRYLR
ncbi:MAG: pilus assembly protein PilM [Burkholderiaceae bacterium]|jgi:type IV pilus assembly protein PilM|nr:pilus assembly protein PilM [Burkholderiaceae bacterium]